MKIYLASPFFNDGEMESVSKAETILRKRGFDVYSPREHELREDAEVGSSAWSLGIFNEDRKFIDVCDCVVMLYHGGYSDSGTAWECGYAYAIHKPVIVVHLGENSNLMIHEGSHTNISMEDLETYDFVNMPVYSYKGKMF
ncbi:MAG: nucleoside 2-deoxyribosyltransferase [Lachnospiraceae bacterium]